MNKGISNLCLLAALLAKDNFKKSENVLKIMKNKKIQPEKIYETILQTYLFCGFPATIEALKLFKKHFSNFRIEYHRYNLEKYQKSGVANCKLIYKKNFKKLISNMAFVSPELKEWMIIEGYGKVLGRKNLSLKERELINVSILSSRYFENQLYSHLKGCLNLGISKKDIIQILLEIKHVCKERNFSKTLKLLAIITDKNSK